MGKMKWIASTALAAATFFSVNLAQGDAAVIWDGAEITAGQTGKLSFNKDTKIYKKNADGSFTSMVAPKGSFYRVYGTIDSSVGKAYNMSGGYRVSATNLVTYKDVPVGVKDQLNVKSTEKNYFAENLNEDEANINYIEVSGLSNSVLQRQINNYLLTTAAKQKPLYLEAQADRDEMKKENSDYFAPPVSSYYDQRIILNSKGYLSIQMDSSTYFGGAHGNEHTDIVHYNLITAKHINLSEFVKTAAARQKLNAYVLQQMKNMNAKYDGALFFVEYFEGVPMNQPFYIHDDGIELLYNQYDMGPYAAGMREIKVPFKVFQ